MDKIKKIIASLGKEGHIWIIILRVKIINMLNKRKQILFILFSILFILAILKLITREKIMKVYQYSEYCKRKEYFHDYTIQEEVKMEKSFISRSGYSGHPYECAVRFAINETIYQQNAAYEKRLDSSDIKNGGLYEPRDCNHTKKVAVIVPYRDRPIQLAIFVNKIHQFLSTQNIYYKIIIIEQDPQRLFNRGYLLNIGVLEALKQNQFNCFVFHDIDRLPKFILNRYDCITSPRHLSVQTSSKSFLPEYNLYAGGVTSISLEHIMLINGFSNIFWGWGGEDDDLYQRLELRDIKVLRVHPCIGQYNFINVQHTSQYRYDSIATILLKSVKQRMDLDGLNSCNYDILNYSIQALYTQIKIELKMDAPSYTTYYHFVLRPIYVIYFSILILLNILIRCCLKYKVQLENIIIDICTLIKM